MTSELQIRKSEYVFPALVVAFFVVIGSFPYLYGYWNEHPDDRFMGVVGRGALHSIGYMMFARQAQEGQNLFENRLTPEPLPRAYFNPEWWLCGRFARWTGMSLAAASQAHRIVAVAAMVFALYYLLARCLATVFQRRLALALIVFGGGFGWVAWCASILYVEGFPLIHPLLAHLGFTASTPTPFPVCYDVEGVTIFGYLINKPHFILAGASIVLVYAFLLEGERTGKTRYFVLSGLAAMANLLIRAFAIYEICAILALYPLLLSWRERAFRPRRFVHYAIAASMTVPVAVYYAFLLARGVLGGGRLEMPLFSFFQYIVRYGLPFVLMFAYFQGPAHVRRMKPSSLLMTLWFAVAFVVAQLYPLLRNGEEAALYSFTIVPAILIVEGPLPRIFKSISGWMKGPAAGPNDLGKLCLAVALVLFCSLSNVVLYGRMFTTLNQARTHYYIPNDLHAALEWLGAHSDHDSVVLSGPVTCPLIPYYAGNKTFTGHDLLTTNRKEKDTIAQCFFEQGGNEMYEREVVHRYGVRYVVSGPYEATPEGTPLSKYPWLEPVFTQGRATVFEVK